MEKLWVIVVSILFCSVAFAGPNNYIGIDEDGKVYELNYGANSGSLNIDEGSHYETYSTSGTDIIYPPVCVIMVILYQLKLSTDPV